MANLTALAVARHTKLNDNTEKAIVYCSHQTHFSVDRALRILGFSLDQIKKLPTDNLYRLDVTLLKRQIEEDRRNGFTPFCVVSNAGTTNTGAVDPLLEIANVCRVENMWFHVDGCYGAAVAFCEKGKALLVGVEHADSLSVDPHKWLFQPYEIGCVLVRNGHWLKDTFWLQPEYLKDVERDDLEVNFCDYGVQLTRSFRALKLWMSLKTFGSKAFGRAIERGFDLAELAQREIGKLPQWEIASPAQMGVLLFRYAPPEQSVQQQDKLNKDIVDATNADGFAMISSTMLNDKTVLRMCPINPRTTAQDIEETVKRLAAIAETLRERLVNTALLR